MTFFCSQNSGDFNIAGSAARMLLWLCFVFVGLFDFGAVAQGACLSENELKDSDAGVVDVVKVDPDDRSLPETVLAEQDSAKSEVERRGGSVKTPIAQEAGGERKPYSGGARSGIGALFSSLGALALTLGAFFGLVYLTKLLTPRRTRRLSETLEIVESCPVDSKNELITIRWGRKLILAAKSSGSWTALSEVSDAEEVEQYLKEADSKRQPSKPGSLGRLFAFGQNNNLDVSQDKNEGQQS